MNKRRFVALARVLAAGTAFCVAGLRHANADLIVYDLNCVLNGLNAEGTCVPGPSFGTVTLEDGGFGTNGVNITVDLFNDDLKFRDLVLNFDALGGSITDITGDLTYISDGFSIPPYTGLFDLGGTGPQGFAGDSGVTAFIEGVGGDLTIANLNQFDSLGTLFVALHIQSIGPGGCSGQDDGSTPCLPGTIGEGSLKIGGFLLPSDDPVVIPEPSTLLLMGGGLLGVGLYRHRRRAS